MKQALSSLAAVLILCLQCRPVRADAKIALLTELSGPFAPNGEDCRKGYEIAASSFARRHPDRRVGALFGDSQGDPKTGLSEMRRTILLGAVAVVTNRSQVGMAMASEADRLGVPLVGVVGHSDFVPKHKYTFRAWPDASQEGAALARAATARGHRVAGIVTLEDEWLVSLSRHFQENFTRQGGTVVYSQSVFPADQDFSSYVTAMKKTQVDAVFVNLGIPQLGPFLKLMAQQRLTARKFSNAWVQKPEVLASAGGGGEDVAFVEASLEVPLLRQEFRSRFGEPPNLMMSYTCFAGASAAFESGAQTARETFTNLNNLTAVETPDGPLAISNREINFPLVVKIIKNGGVQRLN